MALKIHSKLYIHFVDNSSKRIMSWYVITEPHCHQLTVLVYFYALSMYVVLFFEAQALAHCFASICVGSDCMWCCSLNHKPWLTILVLSVCHQYVCGIVFWSTSPGSLFWFYLCLIREYVVLFFEAQALAHCFGSICVGSGSMWCCFLKHKPWLTVLLLSV